MTIFIKKIICKIAMLVSVNLFKFLIDGMGTILLSLTYDKRIIV